jgi:hypothetical protein
MTAPAVQYTLRRLNWREADGGWYRLPGTTRLDAFDDPAQAEEQCRLLEGHVRAAVNPFRCGTSMHDRTSLDEGRLYDWLLDIGLEPPKAKKRSVWKRPHQRSSPIWAATS